MKRGKLSLQFVFWEKKEYLIWGQKQPLLFSPLLQNSEFNPSAEHLKLQGLFARVTYWIGSFQLCPLSNSRGNNTL